MNITNLEKICDTNYGMWLLQDTSIIPVKNSYKHEEYENELASKGIEEYNKTMTYSRAYSQQAIRIINPNCYSAFCMDVYRYILPEQLTLILKLIDIAKKHKKPVYLHIIENVELLSKYIEMANKYECNPNYYKIFTKFICNNLVKTKY